MRDPSAVGRVRAGRAVSPSPRLAGDSEEWPPGTPGHRDGGHRLSLRRWVASPLSQDAHFSFRGLGMVL